MDVPSVDAVVLTWNDTEQMGAAVRSLLDSVDVEIHVVVVDNGSQPPARVSDDVTLVRVEQNLGVAGGRNLGVARGTAEHVCILDSDALLDVHALRELVAILERDADVGLVAPVFVGQPPEASAGRVPSVGRKLARAIGMTSRYGRSPRMGDDDDWPVEFAIGACQVFRRAAFEAVGGLEKSDPFGPEDLDFCVRLRRAGWTIRQSRRARCFHPPRRAHRSLFTARGWRHALAVARYYTTRRLRTVRTQRRLRHEDPNT